MLSLQASLLVLLKAKFMFYGIIIASQKSVAAAVAALTFSK